MAWINIFKPLDFAFGIGLRTELLHEKSRDYVTLRGHPANEVVLKEFSSLDTKSSSLLQHVSIMIAALSVSYTIAITPGVKIILLANIAGYLIVILMTLRVIAFIDTSETDTRHRTLVRELLLRERYYVGAHGIASLLTALLIPAVLFVLF